VTTKGTPLISTMHIPASPTEVEIQLIEQIRVRLNDVDAEYICAKYLLRFIRARKHNVDMAEQMVRKNIAWRQEWDTDKLAKMKPHAVVIEQVPWGIVSIDKYGGPLGFLEVGRYEPSDLSKIKDQLMPSYLCRVEQLYRMYLTWNKDRDHIPQGTLIFDMSGFGFKHYFNYEGHQIFFTFLRILEANYPEFLKRIFVVHCPSGIAFLYRMTRPFLSADTQKKISFIFSSRIEDIREEFLKYFSPEQVPQRYGGTLLDSYKIPTDTV